MSFTGFPEVQALASELSRVLDRYQADVDELVSHKLETPVHRRVSDDIDRIRRCSSPVPELSVPAAAVLIAHSEVIYALWRAEFREPPIPAEEVARILADHRACVERLRRRCASYLAAWPAPVPTPGSGHQAMRPS